jgi:RHS repeat-associated protein
MQEVLGNVVIPKETVTQVNLDTATITHLIGADTIGYENELYFYHGNHLSSTQMITDINANVTQQVFYAPFGEVISESNAYWHNGQIPDFMFNAKELDEENGMYYYRARYYAPPVFTSRDPLFEKYPMLSPYCYTANNPVKFVDPDGKKIRFPKEATAAFKKSFLAAAKHLADHGRIENLKKVFLSIKTIYVQELSPNDKEGPRFSSQEMTIYWSPTIGVETTNYVDLSPATVLDHEFDHAQQYLSNPEQYSRDAKTSDPNYENKEEKRVITGSEQKTARKMGEIGKDEVTRTDHKGRLIETKGPTSNSDKRAVIIKPKE